MFFSFNSNVRIINTTLTFPIKVPTQKAKFSFYKKPIYIANLKIFLNLRFDSASKVSSSKSPLLFISFCSFIKRYFILRIFVPIASDQTFRHAKSISRYSDRT